MVIHDLLLLALHSFLEVCPVSSSWHLKQLGANSTQVHDYHIWLFPIIALYTFYTRKRSKIFSLPLSVIFLSILPTASVYFLLKNNYISKIPLPATGSHITVGILLVAIALRQTTEQLPPITLQRSWILSGLLQSLSLLISGSSRLGMSLGYALIYRIGFLEAFAISFSLNLITLTAGTGLDMLKGHLTLPTLTELLVASTFFCLALFVAIRGKWGFIAGCGCYRIALGLTLLLI